MQETIDISKYIKLEDFLAEKSKMFSSHDLLHRLRVMILATVIASELHIDPTNLIFAAYYHDYKRASDNEGPKHGEKAGKWVEENFKYLYPEISKNDVKEICDLCTKHCLKEEGKPSLNLQILKDADALDRVRLGKFAFGAELKPEFLRLEVSKNLHNDRINTLLFKLTDRFKFSSPLEQLRATSFAISKLNLPIKLPEIPKWVTRDKDLEDLAKHSKITRIYQEFLHLNEKRERERNFLAKYGFDKQKLRNINGNLKIITRKINLLEDKITELATSGSEILSVLRILNSKNPKSKTFVEMKNFLTAKIILKEDWENLVKNQNVTREIVMNSVSKEVLFVAVEKLLGTEYFPQDEDYIKNIIKAVSSEFLSKQFNRVAFYKYILKIEEKKLITKEIKSAILDKLTIQIDNQIWQVSGKIIKKVINPYINYYKDDAVSFCDEVYLLGLLFIKNFPEDEFIFDKQILPMLLNREFGSLELIRKYLNITKNQQIKDKWKLLTRLEKENREEKNTYFYTIREYTKEKSKENLKQIVEALKVKHPEENELKKYNLCLNLPFNNLLNIIYNSKEFFVAWNKSNEKDLQFVAHTFERFLKGFKMLGDSSDINSFKETSTLIRRPNRVYNHATYGYLSEESNDNLFKDIHFRKLNNLFIKIYGDTKIVLKDEMKNRTIYSLLDSIFTYREYTLAYPEARFAKYILDNNYFKINIKHKMLSVTSNYIEAKILEDVTIHDIDTIYLPPKHYNEQTIRSLKRFMPKVKIEKYKDL